MDFDIGSPFDPHNGYIDDEEKIRSEYKNLASIEVPDLAGKDGSRFVIARFLDIDERGGPIGTGPLVYRSKETKDEGNVIMLASHALQTEEGVARLLSTLRTDFCGGDLDEAVSIVDAGKKALGIQAEEFILELRSEREPAKLLMKRHEERTLQLAAASGPPPAKLAEKAGKSGDASK